MAKKRKNLVVKIFAFLALFSIIVGIIGSGLAIFLGGNQTHRQPTPQELEQLLKEYGINSGSIMTGSGGETIISTSTGTTATGETTINTGEVK